MPGDERELVWTALRWPSLEHVVVTFGADGAMSSSGVAVAVLDGLPTRLAYQLVTDERGAVRRVHLTGPRRTLSLAADGHGHWDSHRELDGCIDVDIAITPLTNTLPIRRLALLRGASAEIDLAYVSVPDLIVTRATQRYTRTETGYRYESGTFRADLQVDPDGLVTTYSDLWRREPPSPG